MTTTSVDKLRRAITVRPEDAALRLELAGALRALGDGQGAYSELQRACELAPNSARVWLRLGELLRDGAWPERALAALEHASQLDPDSAEILLALGQVLWMRGESSRSATAFRRILTRDPDSMAAWFALLNLKTERLTDSELAELESAYAKLGEDADADNLILGGFALANALERAGRPREAFPVFVLANARKRASLGWEAERFSSQVDACIETFARDQRSARGDRGREAVFLVGMPRSGSTLLEHCLARHSLFTAGGELPHVGELVAEQSQREGSEQYVWSETLPASEWQAMGDEYLGRARRWHSATPHFTDKSLANWMSIGVIQRMLPGARIIHCCRDPLETAWSCFSQLFFGAQSPFAYDFDELAALQRDHERLMTFWTKRFPGLIHRVDHETLLAEPESEIRRLLEFLELEFEPACLHFGESGGGVSSESAAQVRMSLQARPSRANAYGKLLDPLRQALSTTQHEDGNGDT